MERNLQRSRGSALQDTNILKKCELTKSNESSLGVKVLKSGFFFSVSDLEGNQIKSIEPYSFVEQQRLKTL